MKKCILSLTFMGMVFLGACTTEMVPSATPTTVVEELIDNGPTPIPTREIFSAGELVLYEAQSGDTLTAVAVHFNTTVDEILAANPSVPAEITTLPPGLPMQIPVYHVPLLGTPFKMLPDSEVIFSPAVSDFNIQQEIENRPGFLKGVEDYGYYKRRAAWSAVAVIARNYSINPRLLLTLLEYRSSALTMVSADDEVLEYPMAYLDPKYRGLYRQMLWAAEQLNEGYYGWRIGTLESFETLDGQLIRPDPWQNAGTVALQFLFSRLFTRSDFETASSPEGFYATYKDLWGDPFVYEVELFPANLQQPEISLPFEPHKIWVFTGGPHTGWGVTLPYSALDFAPPSVQGGCVPSYEWVTAPADAVVVVSEQAMVVLDLDKDGDAHTGWVLFLFHLATDDRIAAGSIVSQGDLLGHPSCEGGRSTGTHVHIARLYNGEWISAGGPLAFCLGGWLADYGAVPYEGTLTKGSKSIEASTETTSANKIIYEFP